MKTNKVLEELMEWKRTHSSKVEQYDTLKAKLAQTEEELQAAQLATYGGPKPPPGTPDELPISNKNTTASVKKENVPVETQTTTAKETTTTDGEIGTESNKQPEALSGTPVAAAATTTALDGIDTERTDSSSVNEDTTINHQVAVALLESTDLMDTKPPAVSLEIVDGQNTTSGGGDGGEQSTPAVTSSTSVAPEAESPAVVMLEEEPEKVELGTSGGGDDDKKDDPPPSLFTVDVEVLMDIFGFLDAMDILNTAQINIQMYTKVDNIFGISEDGQTPPAPTPQPTSQTQQSVPSPSTTAQSSVATAAATSSTTTPAAPAAAVSKHSATPSSSSTDSTGPFSQALFSMLQPKVSMASSPARDSSRGAAAQKPQPQQTQPLNAKVAQSMASKLSDAELAAIISMTDKLSKMDKEVNLLRNEKEVLTAKLDGTEAVKQFLIGKVRDVEQKLTRSREDEIKVTQQIASDQEVIAFLDSRVQELEQVSDDLTAEKASTQKELESLKVSTSKKITMLSDMLKYEREKLREDEGDWKATKKVLVKEVKSCRAQIVALQAELDGMKGQNEMLRRAVMSTAAGGGSISGKNNGRTSPARRKYT
mmetsp:Transcript_54084/g.131273  ORF Transcript_54084/g.131273 Transcript_54084/m.131273 type:complete len:595 (+) Transcript_54084:438-2222(+)